MGTKSLLGSNLPCPHGCNKSGLCDRWLWGDVSTVGLLVHEPPAWKPPWLGSPPWRGQCQWNLHAGPHWRSLKTDREKTNKFYMSNFKHDVDIMTEGVQLPCCGQNWGKDWGMSCPAWCWHTMLAISCLHCREPARWRADRASLPEISHLGTKSLFGTWGAPSTLPGSPGATRWILAISPARDSLKLRLLDGS